MELVDEGLLGEGVDFVDGEGDGLVGSEKDGSDG